MIAEEKATDCSHLILGICCLSLLLVGMDVTIVNVALPSIWWMMAGCGALILLLGWTSSTARARASIDRVTALFEAA